MKVETIMSTPVIAVGPQATLREVSGTLVEYGFSAVPVINDRAEIVGIVSEADLLPLETKMDAVTGEVEFVRTRAADRHVGEIMQRSVVTLPRDAEGQEAAILTMRHAVKRIPIVSRGRLVGIVSRHDVVEALSEIDPDHSVRF